MGVILTQWLWTGKSLSSLKISVLWDDDEVANHYEVGNKLKTKYWLYSYWMYFFNYLPNEDLGVGGKKCDDKW